MSDKTGIEWTDATWNPVRGCSRVSEGCRNCYAERVAARFSGPGKPYEGFAKVTAPRDLLDRVGGRRNGWTGEVRLINKHLADPLRWRKPRRIFVNSMSDLFHEKLTNEQIAAVFGVMASAPQHTFQCLTKRSKRMREWFVWVEEAAQRDKATPAAFCFALAGPRGTGEQPRAVTDAARAVSWPLPNVWLGVSVENQDALDERLPDLYATPAAIRFLSCEPLIGPVTVPVTHVLGPKPAWTGPRINWVIAGCESGPGARSCATAWLRSLRDQCEDTDTAFFLKQAHPAVWAKGEKAPGHGADDGAGVITCGPGSRRKPGGVIGAPYLDGKRHRAFPKAP